MPWRITLAALPSVSLRIGPHAENPQRNTAHVRVPLQELMVRVANAAQGLQHGACGTDGRNEVAVWDSLNHHLRTGHSGAGAGARQDFGVLRKSCGQGWIDVRFHVSKLALRCFGA